MLGVSNRNSHYQPFANGLPVALYDTATNRLWYRGFSKPGYSFNAPGIHEFSNGNLMVIATAYPYSTGAPKPYDFYVFVIDSTSPPLTTFTVPFPAHSAVALYPNPAASEIPFQLPISLPATEYQFQDMQGLVMLQGGWMASGTPVDISSLPITNYLYRLRTNDGFWHFGMFTRQ